MKRTLAALGCGIVFGVGLAVSQMVNPAKVLAFFDILGAWDPSLAFVMAGGLAVTIPAFRRIIARGQPLFEHVAKQADRHGAATAGRPGAAVGRHLRAAGPAPASLPSSGKIRGLITIS